MCREPLDIYAFLVATPCPIMYSDGYFNCCDRKFSFLFYAETDQSSCQLNMLEHT